MRYPNYLKPQTLVILSRANYDAAARSGVTLLRDAEHPAILRTPRARRWSLDSGNSLAASFLQEDFWASTRRYGVIRREACCWPLKKLENLAQVGEANMCLG